MTRLRVLEGLKPSERWTVLAGALCWIATGEFFIAEALAASAWPAYSYAAHDISFLGAVTCGSVRDTASAHAFPVCSPRHALMNAGIAVLGLLNLAGLALTVAAWPRTRLVRAGQLLLALGAVGPILVALWPMDTRTALHAAGAVMNFLAGSLGILLFGIGLASTRPLAGWLTVLFGATSLIGFLLFVSETYLFLGRGGMERLSGYPQTIWYMGAGAVLLASMVMERAKDASEWTGTS